jgi:hypothetical protein
MLCKLQERFQGVNASFAVSARVDIVCTERRENLTAPPSTGKQDVQAPLTSCAIHRSKAHGEISLGCPAVTNANENYVSFISLNVF